MEALRIELELEKQQHGVFGFRSLASNRKFSKQAPQRDEKCQQRDSGVGIDAKASSITKTTADGADLKPALTGFSDKEPFSPRRLSAASFDSGMVR